VPVPPTAARLSFISALAGWSREPRFKKKGRLTAALQCHSNLDQLRGRECYRTIFAAPPHCLEAASTGEDGPEQPNRARKRRRILTAAARGRFGIAGNVAGAAVRTDHVGREVVAIGAVLGEVGNRDAAEVDHLKVEWSRVRIAAAAAADRAVDSIGEAAIRRIRPASADRKAGWARHRDGIAAYQIEIESEGMVWTAGRDKIGVRRKRNDEIDLVGAVLGQT